MTDRHRTLVVTLKRDTRDDDLEHYLTVIQSIKGVAGVSPGPVVDMDQHDARQDVGQRYGRVLFALAHDMTAGFIRDDKALLTAVEELMKGRKR